MKKVLLLISLFFIFLPIKVYSDESKYFYCEHKNGDVYQYLEKKNLFGVIKKKCPKELKKVSQKEFYDFNKRQKLKREKLKKEREERYAKLKTFELALPEIEYVGRAARIIESTLLIDNIKDPFAAGGSRTYRAEKGESLIIEFIESVKFEKNKKIYIGNMVLVDGIYAFVRGPNDGFILLANLEILEEKYQIPLNCDFYRNIDDDSIIWDIQACKKYEKTNIVSQQQKEKKIEEETLTPISKPEF